MGRSSETSRRGRRLPMLTIRPSDVNAARAVVIWTLRGVALLLIASGVYLTLKKTLFGLGTNQVNMILDVYEGVGEEHSTYRGLSMLVVGAALAALSRPLARWMIVVPSDACPG